MAGARVVHHTMAPLMTVLLVLGMLSHGNEIPVVEDPQRGSLLWSIARLASWQDDLTTTRGCSARITLSG